MEKLKIRYKYAWLFVSKLPGFHRLMRSNYPQLNNGISCEYRERLIVSGVKGASFIYFISKSVNENFDPHIALSTGVLTGLFDDLIDERFESFATIQHLIREPDKTEVESQQGEMFKELYSDLLAKLDAWQKNQLTGVLEELIEIEKVLKIERNGGWNRRGMYAFFVFLTMIHVSLSDVDREVALKFGEYIQLMDDYEDFNTDDPIDNYFRIHPEFDINAYYINKIKPVLTSIFIFEFNKEFFCEFVETFHIFQTRRFSNYYRNDTYLNQKKREFIKFVIRRFNGNVPF
jgi:hypothetical protein